MCYVLFLDVLYDALEQFSERKFECFDLASENSELYDKIMILETRIDTLVDSEEILERRIEYWRQCYISQCAKYRKLQKVHRNCPKKSIILYR